jgi:hypothetical protein
VHVDAEIYDNYAYLNRRNTVNADTSGRWQERELMTTGVWWRRSWSASSPR